jgi:hypothetical protein
MEAVIIDVLIIEKNVLKWRHWGRSDACSLKIQ